MDKWQVHRHIQDEAIKWSEKMLGSFILYLFNKNRSYIVSFIFDISSAALSAVTNYLLFYKSKGHARGCTTALRGMHSFLYCMYCLTSPSLCSDNPQKPARINSGTDCNTMPIFKYQRSMCWQHTKHFDLTNRLRIDLQIAE